MVIRELRVAGVVVAALVISPAPAGASVEPGPAGLAPATAVLQADDLSVTVSREGDRVVVGRLTTYSITVDNPRPEPVDVTAQASTPRLLEQVTATGGAPNADGVDWVLSVPAEGAATVTVAGVFASAPEGTDRPYRVALTACVLDDDGVPLACDTDIADLESARWLEQWWWLALPLFGLGVWFLRRRRRPEEVPPAAGGEEGVLELGVLELPDPAPRGGHRMRVPRLAARSRTR